MAMSGGMRRSQFADRPLLNPIVELAVEMNAGVQHLDQQGLIHADQMPFARLDTPRLPTDATARWRRQAGCSIAAPRPSAADVAGASPRRPRSPGRPDPPRQLEQQTARRHRPQRHGHLAGRPSRLTGTLKRTSTTCGPGLSR